MASAATALVVYSVVKVRGAIWSSTVTMEFRVRLSRRIFPPSFSGMYAVVKAYGVP
jgi:hypothetical protein